MASFAAVSQPGKLIIDNSCLGAILRLSRSDILHAAMLDRPPSAERPREAHSFVARPYVMELKLFGQA
jgi:hypothetical protein